MRRRRGVPAKWNVGTRNHRKNVWLEAKQTKLKQTKETHRENEAEERVKKDGRRMGGGWEEDGRIVKRTKKKGGDEQVL